MLTIMTIIYKLYIDAIKIYIVEISIHYTFYPNTLKQRGKLYKYSAHVKIFILNLKRDRPIVIIREIMQKNE